MELTTCDMNGERIGLGVQDRLHLCNKEMNYLWHKYSKSTELALELILPFCNNENLEYGSKVSDLLLKLL